LPSKPSTRPIEPAPASALSFEEALRQYEEVVAHLEAGGQSLESSLALWKRGEELKARCEQVLREAELTLQTLVLTDEGELELEESGE